MNLTESQKSAIDIRDSSLIISAGAGSGKTAVLTERILERMGGRRVCKACGATYHVVFNPSPNGDKCACGEELTIRSDDKPEVVKSRLDTYHEQTEPLKDFYNAKGILKIVEGQEKLEDTTALTKAALEA